MTFPVLPASNPSGYIISRSVRLRSSASAYFNRTNSSSPTNAIKWTWSGWVKRGSLGAQQNLVGATNSGSDDTYFNFNSSDKIVLGSYTGAGTDYGITTAAVFRDPSAWYHVVAVLDTANATSADRAIIYVNGVRQTVTNSANGMWPQNATNNKINAASQVVNIGRRSLGDSYLDGYLTEINFIDGQALTPSSFGETDTITGVWKPKKYAGTYGTNGFYINFSDNSAATATTIGKDYSGNGNNWTPNNISVTSGVTYDSMIDVPTVSGAGSNYAVLNPLAPSSYVTLSAGNLTATGNTATNSGMAVASIGTSTGKYVWEETITTVSGNFPGVGATTVILQDGNGQNPGASNTLGFYYRANGTIYKNSASLVGTYSTFSNGDVVRFELDADALTCAVYKNNTLIVTITGLTAGTFYPSNVNYNGSVTNSNFGQRPFTNTPNTGFVALNTNNLPNPTINNGALYMAATLWTGDQTARTINNSVNGISFKPDFVWTKSRSNAESHRLSDSVRGGNGSVLYELNSNETSAEGIDTLVSGFASNGFTIASGANSPNVTGRTYVGWQWQAGAGTSSSNTAGSITSTVSVNATAGFSVVTYTGTGANATVGHGLGVAPSMIIIKNRSQVSAWIVGHQNMATSTPWAGFMVLNQTAAYTTASGNLIWNSTAPTSTVFSVGTDTSTNFSGNNLVAYCFSAVAGYSAFGSYTGNGSSDGPFVYLGFRPRWIMVKNTSAVNQWNLWDTSRDTYNVMNDILVPNSSGAETNSYPIDVTANGFKIRGGAGLAMNDSSNVYIYAAFAENPFKLALAR